MISVLCRPLDVQQEACDLGGLCIGQGLKLGHNRSHCQRAPMGSIHLSAYVCAAHQGSRRPTLVSPGLATFMELSMNFFEEPENLLNNTGPYPCLC